MKGQMMSKMRTYLLAGTAATLLAVSGAVAADMPVKTPPQSQGYYGPNLGPWTGWYIGAGMGYGWDWSGMDIANPITFATLGNSPHGFTGGGHFGGDYQVGNLVFGVVTSINGANFQSGNTASSGGLALLNSGALTHWWWDFNGRLGFSGFGNHVLPYIGGGVAAGGTKADLSMLFDKTTLANSVSNTSVGWDVIIGIETRIDQHWSFNIDGKFVDLGSVQVPLFDPISKTTIIMTGNQKFQFGVIEGKVNYRF